MSKKEVNQSILEKYYKKYMYVDGQSIKTDWDAVIADYNHYTNQNKSYNQLRYRIKPEDRTRLWLEKKGHSDGNKIQLIAQDEDTGALKYQLKMAVKEFVNATPEDVIRVTGLDVKRWTLHKFRITDADIGTTKDGIVALENLWVGVEFRPTPFAINEDTLADILEKVNIPSVEIESEEQDSEKALVIPIFDPHFGINTFKSYESHIKQILAVIEQGWDEIVLTTGQDMLHNDDFTGKTSHGTQIEQVDMEMAVEEAAKFYSTLIERALEHSNKVKVIYSPGNHDESMGWLFTWGLAHKYPQVEFDLDMEQIKTYNYGGDEGVFLAFHHGHKITDNRLFEAVTGLFRREMGLANRRIIFRGHKHTHKSVDKSGTTLMALGTAAKTDQWHKDMGFVANHKAFEIFAFDKRNLIDHKYINGEDWRCEDA